MTPDQKRQKLKEMEARSKAKRQTLKESGMDRAINESTYVWHNDELVLVPKSVI